MPEHVHPYDNYGYAVTSLNAQRSPDALGIRYRGTDYSFAEVNARVNRTANALCTLGVRPGDRVAVQLDDVMAIVDSYLALAKLGAVLVALNPYWSDEVLAQVLAHCRVQHMLLSGADRARLQAAAGEPAPALILVDGAEAAGSAASLPEALAAADDVEPPLGAGGAAPLAFFFTSGTTGMPKPAVHSHASCRSMADIWLSLPRTESSMWGTGPIIWGIGFPCTIGAALFVGMPVVLEDDFGPAGFTRAMRHSAITHMTVIPTFWSELLALPEAADLDLGGLEAVIVGGEPLGDNLLRAMMERAPGAGVYSFYGQTEAPYTCIGRLDDGSQTAAVAGLARPTCAAQVLSPDGRRVTAEPGELAVTGPHLMREYFDLPEKTAESLRDGWFFSGDLALQDERGRITVLGRREDAIHRGGRFIQPLTIEDAALGLDGVLEAGAVAVPSDQGDDRILLALRCAGEANERDLRAALAGVLPPDALPDRIVLADELPHGNDNSGGKGKLLRREIGALYAHLLDAEGDANG